MTEKNLENLTYKEALRLLINLIDEQGERIQSIDEREIHLQKVIERLMGQMEGKKEAKEESRADWKLVLTVVGVIVSILLGIAGLIW